MTTDQAASAAARCPAHPDGATRPGAGHHGYEPFDMSAPFASYARLRAEAPVHYDERVGHWVVARYADVKAVFDDWETFSSENAQRPVRPLGEPARRVLAEGRFTAYSGLSARVPPDHTRIRKVATKCFTPRRYRVLEPLIRGNVDAMLDAMVARGTPGDLVADLAWDLPTITLLMLLGVPEERIPQVKEWAAARSAITWGDLTDDEQVPHAHRLVEYWRFCESLVAGRHAAPGDDLVSDLVRLQGEGEGISDHEIASLCWSMLFAGHETTTTLISNALRELLAHPAQWARLTADPRLAPAAVDEVLRYSPSIVAWRRRTLAPAVVGGVEIPEGADVLLLMGSANRDEDVFSDPETFDVTRGNARAHLSFGFGIHYCLGNQLAKLQARIVLEQVVARLPSLRLAPGAAIRFGHSLSFRTPEAVPVEWDQ
ncbi:cytochrome P450 [Nonomuraea pusilla]|uniref:cytochrome P450 n=1 Tax=Nonomuraea pusilla TaxID=46177 RepID=UPI003316726E